MAVFRDWIPDGEDVGALGRGFKDFVPAEEPVKREEPTIPEVTPVVATVPEVPTNAVDDILAPRKRDKKGKKNG